MTNALLSPVLHDIHVSVVSAEEASFGVAEFWSGDRLPWPQPSRRPTASSRSTERTRKA
jgi:hypothetical protein